MAGSAAVEAAACPDDSSRWRGGDVDIFTTWDAAPHARFRLEHHCKLVCTGVPERYKYTEESGLITVHHVENYCPRHVFADDDGSFTEATYQMLKLNGDLQLSR